MLPPLLHALIPLIRQAGVVVMSIYRDHQLAVTLKDDQSPVTAADQAAETLITAGLHALTPSIPVIAEEAHANGHTGLGGEQFWLVDPLDGTKEFIQGRDEFTINIALIQQGRPQLGLILAPALGHLYFGARGHGAWCDQGQGPVPIRCRRPPASGLTVIASRSHSDPQQLAQFLHGQPVAQHISAGSSLKLCLIAAGQADLYPRLGRTMEWDIAAGQAILEAAGGQILTLNQQTLRYGKAHFENPHFVAHGLR